MAKLAKTFRDLPNGMSVVEADDDTDAVRTFDGDIPLGREGFWLVGVDADHADKFFGRKDDLTSFGAKFIGPDLRALLAWMQNLATTAGL